MTFHHVALLLVGACLAAPFVWTLAANVVVQGLASDVTDLEAQADALDQSRRQLERDADLLHEAKKAHFDRVAASIVRQVQAELPWAHPAARRGWLQ